MHNIRIGFLINNFIKLILGTLRYFLCLRNLILWWGHRSNSSETKSWFEEASPNFKSTRVYVIVKCQSAKSMKLLYHKRFKKARLLDFLVWLLCNEIGCKPKGQQQTQWSEIILNTELLSNETILNNKSKYLGKKVIIIEYSSTYVFQASMKCDLYSRTFIFRCVNNLW